MQQVLQNTICILNRKCGAWSVERGGRDLGNKLIEIERKFCRPSRAKVGGTFPFSLFFMFIDFLLLLLYFFALATLCLLFGIASLFSFVRLLFADYILAPHLHAHPHPPLYYLHARFDLLACLEQWMSLWSRPQTWPSALRFLRVPFSVALGFDSRGPNREKYHRFGYTLSKSSRIRNF